MIFRRSTTIRVPSGRTRRRSSSQCSYSARSVSRRVTAFRDRLRGSRNVANSYSAIVIEYADCGPAGKVACLAMTDAQLTPTDVRAAAEALKAAIDAHLAAVEARGGEADPVVQEAYTVLHDAAAAYDDVLFEVYDEVTPFVLADTEDLDQIGAVGTDGGGA